MLTRIPTILVLYILTVYSGFVHEPVIADDSKYMDRPFAVAAFAGIERFEEDLDRLVTISDHPELTGKYLLLKSMIIGLPGIDYSRPIGAALVLQREKLQSPVVIAFLPVTHGESLMKSLQQKFSAIQDVDEGRWQVNLPKQQLQVVLQAKYLLISNSEEVFATISDEFLTTLQDRTRLNDVYAHIDLAGLSDSNRQTILQKVDKDLKKEEARKPEESEEEYRLRLHVIRLIKTSITHIVKDSQSLTAGIQIESEVTAQLNWLAKSDSVLADQLKALRVDQPTLTSMLQKDAPFQAQLGVKIPQYLQAFLLEAFQFAREQIKKEIGPKLAAADRGPVSEVFDALQNTAERRVLNAIVTFEESENNEMILIGGLNVVGSELVKNFLETILPYAQDSEDITEVDLNFHKSESITLHRLQGRKQRAEDRRLYGESASLYVGTSSETFWIANGGQNASVLLDEYSKQPRRLEDGPLLRVDFSLNPWLRIAEKHQRDLKKIQMIRRAIPDADNDQIIVELKNIPNGLSATLNAEEGYLKLFGIALKEDQKKND